MGEYFYPGDDVIDSLSDPIFVTKFVEHLLRRGECPLVAHVFGWEA